MKFGAPFFLLIILSCNPIAPVSKCASEVASTRWTSLDQAQLLADIQAIDNYLDAHGIDAVKHPSGVRYVITQAGTGDNIPCLENVFSCTYEGRLLTNNTIFDSSKKPIAFILKNLIPGWQIPFLQMNKGAKVTIYVPSGLGYGSVEKSSGRESISYDGIRKKYDGISCVTINVITKMEDHHVCSDAAKCRRREHFIRYAEKSSGNKGIIILSTKYNPVASGRI